jgi:hypothetical protein
MENNELEVLVGQNVLSALADIVFDDAKKVEIPFKLKTGLNYKITVEEVTD